MCMEEEEGEELKRRRKITRRNTIKGQRERRKRSLISRRIRRLK